MIGDVVIDGRITFSKLGVVETLGTTGIKLGVAGKYAKSGRASATTADAILPIDYLSALGLVGIQNVNASLVSTPSAPTIIPMIPGATTYSYKVVAVQADGGYSVASAAGTITNGNATPSDMAYNRVDWVTIDDAFAYNVYRTAGGGTQGLVGQVFAPTTELIDNALVGDGSSAPATSPYDFQLQFGPSSGDYPILARGGDMLIMRWASNAVHFKATYNPCDFAFIIIEP